MLNLGFFLRFFENRAPGIRSQIKKIINERRYVSSEIAIYRISGIILHYIEYVFYTAYTVNLPATTTFGLFYLYIFWYFVNL